jgi:Zn-dependent M28 family amino/carboxypeptidase
MNLRTWWRHLTVVAVVALTLSVGLGAQSKSKLVSGPTTIRVDGNVIKSYIAYMASDDKEGRRSLTPGYEKVAEWAAGKFKEWGLKPAGDNGTFLQDVPVTGGFTWTTGIPELTVDGRTFYIKDSDFALDSRSTPGAQASGEIVFVGYGISAPAKGLDEYAGVDVKGKIVIALKGAPKDAPAARGMFGATVAEPKEIEPWTDESKDQAKIKAAYDKGAAAVVLFAPEKLSPAPTSAPGQLVTQAQAMAMLGAGGGQAGEPLTFTRPFLVVSDIDVRVFRHLMYRDPQESSRGFTARVDQWRRDIRDKKPHSLATGIKGSVKGYATVTVYGEKQKNNVSHNVVGKVEGTDPKLKSQVIVIGGHLDHVGMTNGVVFNGADDDASGAATTMEMARLFAANAATIKPKRTIYFALWCAEEFGLVGSAYWVKHPTDGVKIDNVVANFNNDMVGLGDRIGAPGGLNFPTIWEVIMRNQEPDVVKNLETSTAGPGGSDYAAFIEQGIEALALMTAGGIGHPDYHDAGDDTAKIDAEMLRKNGQFVLQGAINVANETTVNLLIPDRLHLYNGMRMSLLNLDTVRSGGGAQMYIMTGPSSFQAAPQQGTRFSIGLDVAAFGGNLSMIDMAAKSLSVGRVQVAGVGDGTWFGSNGVTDRGKEALKAFETAGMVLQLVNPPARLLESMLDNAKKGFLVTGLTTVPDAALSKRITEKNVVLSVEFDVAAPQAVVARLEELKKALGGSGNLVLTTQERTGTTAMGNVTPTPRQKALDAAKQQLYLALIKNGWTKDEIGAIVGVTPPRSGPMQMPPPPAPRLGGNLGKLL